MSLTSNGIGIEAEIVVKATVARLRITEVVVDYLPRTTGVAKGDMPRNIVITIRELLALKRQQRARQLNDAPDSPSL